MTFYWNQIGNTLKAIGVYPYDREDNPAPPELRDAVVETVVESWFVSADFHEWLHIYMYRHLGSHNTATDAEEQFVLRAENALQDCRRNRYIATETPRSRAYWYASQHPEKYKHVKGKGWQRKKYKSRRLYK